eukprot:3534626-Pyramimonas_sp.AAC.1
MASRWNRRAFVQELLHGTNRDLIYERFALWCVTSERRWPQTMDNGSVAQSWQFLVNALKDAAQFFSPRKDMQQRNLNGIKLGFLRATIIATGSRAAMES